MQHSAAQATSVMVTLRVSAADDDESGRTCPAGLRPVITSNLSEEMI